jgi:hypothetical protein
MTDNYDIDEYEHSEVPVIIIFLLYTVSQTEKLLVFTGLGIRKADCLLD